MLRCIKVFFVQLSQLYFLYYALLNVSDIQVGNLQHNILYETI
jgi:hypothetical protein